MKQTKAVATKVQKIKFEGSELKKLRTLISRALFQGKLNPIETQFLNQLQDRFFQKSLYLSEKQFAWVMALSAR